MTELVVASFNTHAGIDGWGRRFDVVEVCKQLDADVLVLQEAWIPDHGDGHADQAGRELGYEVRALPLAAAMMLPPHQRPGRGWGPSGHDPLHPRRLWVGGGETAQRRRRQRFGSLGEEGTWGLAVLSRLPVRGTEAIELGHLHRDFTRRAALALDVELAGVRLRVVGTHLAHLSHGSPAHLWSLRRQLPDARTPAVLAGDMNLWGPPIAAALPGWRRAVRARTYPARRPHSQIDHIFATRAVTVIRGEVLALGDSDHRPIRARLAL